jgi:TolA-binding protein
LEFLLENPFILIALIAFISSFFKKKKEEKPVKQTPRSVQQEQRAQAERTSADSALAETLKEEYRQQEEKAKRIEEEYRQQEEKAKKMEEEYRQRKQQAEESMKALQNQRRAAERKASKIAKTASNTNAEHRKEPSGAGSFEFRKQSLADGIIWSEILGPPRSKNPHRSLNRKQ